MAMRKKARLDYKKELERERKRMSGMTAEQAECERAERIEAFERNNPEISEMLDDAISHILIQEHIRLTGMPADEYRTYEIIAVTTDDLCGDARQYRILLEDIESGVRHLLTATTTLKTTESAAYDVDSVCRYDILDDLIWRDNNKPAKYIGCTISLRTIYGVPTLPMAKEKYKKELREIMKD